MPLIVMTGHCFNFASCTTMSLDIGPANKQVDDRQINRPPLKHAERLGAVKGLEDFGAGRAQHIGDGLAHLAIVVDDEKFSLHGVRPQPYWGMLSPEARVRPI